MFGGSTLLGAAPSVKLKENTDDTLTISVKGLAKEIYGIQVELTLKEALNQDKELRFISNYPGAYTLAVVHDNKINIYLSSDTIISTGQDFELGRLVDIKNDQLLEEASYKIVDYFFNPLTGSDVKVTDKESLNKPAVSAPTTTTPSTTPSVSGTTVTTPSTSTTPTTQKVVTVQSEEEDLTVPSATSTQTQTQMPQAAPVNTTPTTPSTTTQTTQTPTQNTVAKATFTDTQTHWATTAINRMSEKGILKGYTDGTFAPNKEINKAEFAAVVVRAFELKGTAQNMNFKDVASGKWYTDAVSTLFKNGIVSGRSDGTFGVDKAVTNEEMAVILARTLKTLGVSPKTQKTYVAFKDDAAISSYAKEAVQQLYEMGIVNGTSDGSFNPKAPATRAQTAVLVDRILTLLESK
jgi:hypothetical protein